jgi:hypothetical protein
MGNLTRLFILAVVAGGACGTAVFASDEETARIILGQWRRYNEVFSAYQAKSTQSDYDLVSGKNDPDYLAWEYKQRGPWTLTRMEFRKGIQGGNCTCKANNSEYAFDLSKDNTGEQWRLREVRVSVSPTTQVGEVDGFGSNFAAYFSPYCLGDSVLVYHLLRRPGFTAVKSEPISDRKMDLLKIWFRVVPDENSEKERGTIPIEGDGWLLFEPKCYWRLHAAEVPYNTSNEALAKIAKPSKQFMRFEYTMAEQDYPLLKELEVTNFPYGEDKPDFRIVTTYTLVKRVPDEAEFRLSAFGLPEPIAKEITPWWARGYVWLSLAAIACFVACFHIRRRMQRTEGA